MWPKFEFAYCREQTYECQMIILNLLSLDLFLSTPEEHLMPYSSNSALPDAVKAHLPKHAQDIYRAAFNSAWEEYRDPEDRQGDESREAVAHKVAWTAVKQKYQKSGKDWVEK